MGLDVFDETGAPIYSGHSWRGSGAIFLAKAGIDVWRIQLHGRWGSAAVLRYVRLAPLHSSLAVEASLQRDLSAVREAIIAAKARLSQLTSGTLQPMAAGIIADTFGDALARGSGPLGLPSCSELLDGPLAGRMAPNRKPLDREVLVHNFKEGVAHALRPPSQASILGESPSEISGVTWCGWAYGSSGELDTWTGEVAVFGRLCKRCFGGEQLLESAPSETESD